MGLVSVKFSIFLFVSNDSLQVPGDREMLKLSSGVCHSPARAEARILITNNYSNPGIGQPGQAPENVSPHFANFYAKIFQCANFHYNFWPAVIISELD